MKLRVPWDRWARFRTSLFTLYTRRTVNLADLVIVQHLVEVFEHEIEEVVGNLAGRCYPHVAISRITGVRQEKVQAFRERRSCGGLGMFRVRVSSGLVGEKKVVERESCGR